MKTVVVLAAASFVFLSPVPVDAEISIEFADSSVQACRLTPGGRAVFFYAGWPTQNVLPRFETNAELDSNVDKRGCTTFQLGSDIPVRSMWCVVDFETGDAGMALATGYPIREFDFPADGLQPQKGSDSLVSVHIEGRALSLLVVRPGYGAWRRFATDGGPYDADHEQNRAVSVRLDEMAPVSKSEVLPPDSFVSGDIVVVFDPDTMSVLHAVVD